MPEEISLEIYLNGLLWDPRILVIIDKAENFVKDDLVVVSIVNDIFRIQESNIVDISEYVDDAYGEDALEAIF